MLSIAEAWSEIMGRVPVLPEAQVPLADAHQRCLARTLTAQHALPGFDNSAMDGYAVRYSEVAARPAGPWPLAGESRAGGAGPAALPEGQVSRIFTGAPMPAGADTVVMQENALSGLPAGQVGFAEGPRFEGQHVRLRGSDLRVGAPTVEAGRPLHGGELALLASQGHAAVSVHGRPRVAILCTGDELCDVDGAGQPGRVVNSNAYALAAQVREAGCEPLLLPPAPDRLEAVVECARAALDADVLISAGGVSVGDYDVVGRALETLGVQTHFWKVAIKPGKPVLFGTLGQRPVFGLPGNPISAMVTFEVFVRPALRKMQGDSRPFVAPLRARLASDRKHGHGRTEFVRARLAADADGLRAELLQQQGSGSLPSMVGVDALVMLPAGVDVYAAGTEVLALPLHSATRVATPLG